MTSPGTSPGNDLGTSPRTPGPLPRWRRVFPGRDDQVREVRRWLAGLLPGAPERDDVIVVAVELVTNAIRHTASGCGGLVMVEVTWYGPVLRVTVADDGATQGPRLTARPGRGSRPGWPNAAAGCTWYARWRPAPECAGISAAGWCGPISAGPAPAPPHRRCPRRHCGPAGTGRCRARPAASPRTRPAVAAWSAPWP